MNLRLIIVCACGLGVLGIAAWASGAIFASKPAAPAVSTKVFGAKKDRSGSPAASASQPWDGAAAWMGNWAGSWNNTAVLQTYGNGSCSFSKVETFALNIAARSQDKLSGTLVTELDYGHELTLKDAGGRATKFVIRACPAPGANYDTAPPSHVSRRYTIDVIKSASAKTLLRRVLADCKFDNRPCPKNWWVGTPDAALKLSGQRMDYVETDEKPEAHIVFSREDASR